MLRRVETPQLYGKGMLAGQKWDFSLDCACKSISDKLEREKMVRNILFHNTTQHKLHEKWCLGEPFCSQRCC